MFLMWKKGALHERLSTSKESATLRLMAPPPKNNNENNNTTAGSKPTSRTFNMSIKDAIVDNDVISGTLLVNFVNACVLVDSGL